MQHELTLSIQGDPNNKPLARSVVNTFIKEGVARTDDPQSNGDHYIDYNDNYHIRNRGEHLKGKPKAIGYQVQTRGPGRFPIRFKVTTEEGEGEHIQPAALIDVTQLSGGTPNPSK